MFLVLKRFRYNILPIIIKSSCGRILKVVTSHSVDKKGFKLSSPIALKYYVCKVPKIII